MKPSKGDPMDDHAAQIATIRGRQLALIQTLPAEDALIVLAAAPVDSDEEHEIVADLLQRRLLADHVEAKEKP